MIPVTVSGHFGEWIEGRMGPDGPGALVAVSCPVFRVTAPRDGAPEKPAQACLAVERASDLLVFPAPDHPFRVSHTGHVLRELSPLGAAALQAAGLCDITGFETGGRP